MNNARIIKIDSLDIPELQIYKSGNEAQLLHFFEPHGGLFIAESPMVVERALNAGYKPYSMLLDESLTASTDDDSTVPESIARVRAILDRCGDIPVYCGPETLLGRLTGFKLTRGILCAMYRKDHHDPDSICLNSTRIAVLDGVENPANVGSIFRNAAALGIDAVLLTDGCSDPFYRRSLRVSMGTSLILPWAILSSAPAASDSSDDNSYIGKLHQYGFTVAAMALRDSSLPPCAPELKNARKLAVILGNEGVGLPDEIINKSDYTVMIPMQRNVDSLNVAAASAIAFWECGKQSSDR